MDPAHNINQNPAYRHTPLTETDLNPDEDTIPLMGLVQYFSTLNLGQPQEGLHIMNALFRQDRAEIIDQVP
jgi:hypothetical protein